MTHKIIRSEITYRTVEEFHIETKGDLKHMPSNAEMVSAHFGTFERTGNGTLLYSAGIAREADGTMSHDPETEYSDDYRALVSGKVTVIY